jgi:hypothetical protein
VNNHTLAILKEILESLKYCDGYCGTCKVKDLNTIDCKKSWKIINRDLQEVKK